jgi:hypothetical protein
MNERRRVRIRRDCPRFGVRQCVSGLPGSLISGASCTVVGSSGAGYRPDRVERREVLRRLFILRLDRDSEAPQRRVSRQSDLPADLMAFSLRSNYIKSSHPR